MSVAVVVPTKRCTTCERELFLEEFQVKVRDRNGNVVRLFASCRSCRQGRVRARISEAERLEVPPFRGWLERRLEAEGVWNATEHKPVKDHRAPRNIEMIAKDWGTSAKRLQDIIKGRVSTVTDDYVDRVLTAAGVPHLLGILYDMDVEEIAL